VQVWQALGPDHTIARTTRDRGASPVELAILWPVLLLLVFSAVQVATYFTARTVALTAAQAAVTTERVHGATPGDGRHAAESFLAGSGDWLRDARVSDPVYTGDGVRYTVTGTALTLVPGLTWRVSHTAHGTLEQFTT
jgi:Flp pilus assembly protein TadG